MIKKISAILLVFIWMILIFSFSNQNGDDSQGLSDQVITGVADLITDIDVDSPSMDAIVDKYSFIVRKLAHFFVYFILGLLIMNALYIWGIRRYTTIIAASLVILYAITDEVHQFYVGGRSSQISDVLLDSSAGMLAIYLYHKIIYLKGR